MLGIHTGWGSCTLKWRAAPGRAALGDEGIDGILVDSAANDGALCIDYRSGEVMLPHWIQWLFALGRNGIQVVSEMPQAFGLGNFIHDNPKRPCLCFMAFNNVLGQGRGPDPEMDEKRDRTGNEHAPMYFCRVRGCHYDTRGITPSGARRWQPACQRCDGRNVSPCHATLCIALFISGSGVRVPGGAKHSYMMASMDKSWPVADLLTLVSLFLQAPRLCE